MTFASTLRSLGRARGLTLAIGITLSLGVAALTTTFAVFNAALLRPPPFRDAASLAMLYLERNPEGESPYRERWSFSRFEALRQSQRSFELVASYSPASLTLASDAPSDPASTPAGRAGAEVVMGERVSAAYFQVLRTAAAHGRLFDEADDDPTQPSPVVLIGDRLWTRRFARDPSALGSTLRLNGVPLTILGVLPPGFTGLSGRAEVWIPRTMAPQVTYAEYLTTNQNFISAVGRLRSGVALETARGELAALGAEIQRSLPSDPAFPNERVTATAIPIGEARVDPAVRRSLAVLAGAVALLHLLACANVANLLLGRAAAKRREAAIRIALGGGGRRLFGHFLGDGVRLAAPGAVSGIGLAWWVTGRISPPADAWAPRNFYGSLAPFDAPAFSLAELVFGAGLAVLTALLVAVVPALVAARTDVSGGVAAGARSAGVGLTLRRPSARGLIVGVETAVAMLLAVAAGLLLDSFQRMRRASVGVDSANVLTFWVMPSESRIPPATAPAFVARLLEAVARVPGVVSASVDGGAPLSGTARSTLFLAGRPAPAPGQAPPVLRHYVGPDHFRTLRIPLLRGRVFSPTDTADSPRVAVISETAARRFWPDEEAIGKRVWFGSGSSDSVETSTEVVGIVADVLYEPFDRQPNLASFYTPYPQFTYASRMVFLRTAGDPLAVLPDVRQAIAAVDPELALQDVQPLDELLSGSWARRRFDAYLFGGFGVAAVLLAASGVFAVLAHAVAARTREFGIRIALGEDDRRLVRQVLREGMAFPLAGLLAGIAASVACTRVLQTSLYEVSPLEPSVFLAVSVLLLVVAAGACLVPAWRATRADPIEALRAE